jgi:hypothetical protein
MSENDTAPYTIDDFTEQESDGDRKRYILNRSCVIFGRTFDGEPVEIEIDGAGELSRYIPKINESLRWIGGECREELIAHFNEHVDYREEKTGDRWYEALETDSVLIAVDRDGAVTAEIAGGDNFLPDHLMEIEFTGKKISRISYDG